jgi:hypothetical protein
MITRNKSFINFSHLFIARSSLRKTQLRQKPNQETESMEVQKHPHHVTHKKKWGEYLLEFIMLFLAVFLGFIAENIREHIVENDRAKEYAVSLMQDLQNDTTSINVQLRSGKIYIAITDSLLDLSKSRLEGRNAAKFSFYTRFVYWTVPLSWNRATFEQIKNSGSLRYFKNYQLLEKLMKYDGLVNEIEGEFSNHQIRGNMLLTLIDQIIDPGFHHDLSKYRLFEIDTMSKATMEKYFSAKIEPLENKRNEIRGLLNIVVVQQRNIRFNNDRLLHTKKLANELISDLKKEYKIDQLSGTTL